MSSKKGFGNSDSYIGYETVIQPNNKIKQGQIHPEIGKIREKFLRKDLKLFKKFAVSHFCRPCYENEKDTYPDEAFKHLENGKDDCDSMACFLIDSETRVALPQNSKKLKEFKMPDFPTNPYKGQIFYDPDSDTIYEYFVPREDDYFCKKLNIKPKWVVPSYESELVTGLFSKNQKVKYFSYKKLIEEFGYTEETITDLMEELKQ